MSSTASDSSDEKVASSDNTSTSEANIATLIDETLPAKYAETMRKYSRLSSGNEPSMSSRVLLLGILGLLFYFAIKSKWELRLIKARLFPTEDYDQDYTGLLVEQ